MKDVLVFIVVFGLGFVLAWMLLPRGEVVTIPGDTTLIEVPVEIPVVTKFYIHDTIVQTLPEYIYDTILLTQFDTIKIVEAYLGKVFYSDTIKGEDFKAVINDTISQNRIISRQFFHQDLEDYEIQKKWFIGSDLYYTNQLGISFVGGFQDQNRIYTIGIGLDYYKAGIYFKF